MHELRLNGNSTEMFEARLKDIDILALAEAIEESGLQLSLLDLSYNEFGDTAARALCRMVKVSSPLIVCGWSSVCRWVVGCLLLLQ